MASVSPVESGRYTCWLIVLWVILIIVGVAIQADQVWFWAFWFALVPYIFVIWCCIWPLILSAFDLFQERQEKRRAAAKPIDKKPNADRFKRTDFFIYKDIIATTQECEKV